MVLFKDVEVTHEMVIEALDEFASLYPDPNAYKKWLDDDKYDYAISYNGRLYPPKYILSTVTGIAIKQLRGGDRTNNVFRALGFTIESK